jgi:hypothetical protein
MLMLGECIKAGRYGDHAPRRSPRADLPGAE